MNRMILKFSFSNMCNIWYNFSLTLSSRGTAFKCHSLNVLNSTATFKSSWIPFIVPKQIQSSFHNEGNRVITTIQCQQGFLCAFRLWLLLFPPQVGSWKWSKNLMLQPILQGYTFRTLKPQNCNQYAFWCRHLYELGLCFIFKVIGKKEEKKMYSQQRAELKKKKQLCGPQFPVIKRNEYFTGTLNWIMAYH